MQMADGRKEFNSWKKKTAFPNLSDAGIYVVKRICYQLFFLM